MSEDLAPSLQPVEVAAQPGQEVVPFDAPSQELVPFTPPSQELVPVEQHEAEDVADANDVGMAVAREVMAPYEYGAVDVQEDYDQRAQQYAEKRLGDDLEQGNFFSKMFKRSIKGNIFRSAAIHSYKNEFRKAVEAAGGDFLAVINATRYGKEPQAAVRASQRANQVLLEQLLDTEFPLEAEDTRVELAETTEQQAQVRAAIKDIVLRYANGELTQDELEAERNRLFEGIEGLNKDLFGNGAHSLDNLVQLANNVKADIENNIAMERVAAALDEMQLHGLEKGKTLNSSSKKSIIDTFASKLDHTVLGGSALAPSIVFGAAVAYGLFVKGGTSVANAALKTIGVGFLTGGAIAATNEYMAVRREDVQARTEAALGLEVDSSTNSRREAIEALIPEMDSATKLIGNLQSFFGEENGELREDITIGELAELQKQIARIDVLREVGAKEKLDLIAYDGEEEALVQKYELLKSLADARVRIGKFVSENPEFLLQDQSQSTTEFLSKVYNDERTELIGSEAEGAEIGGEIGERLNSRQAAYNALMRNRLIVAGAVGTAAGIGVGVVISEATALANPNVNGLFGAQDSGKANTLLSSILREHNTSGGNTINGPMHLVGIKGGPQLELPKGYDAQFGAKGDITVVQLHPNGSPTVVADNLHFDAKGHLTPASDAKLAGLGISTSESIKSVAGKPTAVDALAYNKAHAHEMVTGKNTLMDNNTVGADRNELKLQAGGKEGSWINKNGDVVIRTGNLEAAGSVNGTTSVNAVEALKDGKLKILVTPAPDGKPGITSFEFTVQDHKGQGVVVIPKGSPAYEFFAKGDANPSNDYAFKGQYLSMAVDRGVNTHGVHNFAVINSVEGANDAKLTVGHNVKVVTTELLFSGPEGATNGETTFSFGPPIYPRRGIGAPARFAERPEPTPEPQPGPLPEPTPEPSPEPQTEPTTPEEITPSFEVSDDAAGLQIESRDMFTEGALYNVITGNTDEELPPASVFEGVNEQGEYVLRGEDAVVRTYNAEQIDRWITQGRFSAVKSAYPRAGTAATPASTTNAFDYGVEALSSPEQLESGGFYNLSTNPDGPEYTQIRYLGQTSEGEFRFNDANGEFIYSAEQLNDMTRTGMLYSIEPLAGQPEQGEVESLTYEIGEAITSKEAVTPGMLLFSDAGWYGRPGLVRYIGQDADGKHQLEVIQDNGDLSEAVVLGSIRVTDKRFTTNLGSGRYSGIVYTNEPQIQEETEPDVAVAPRIADEAPTEAEPTVRAETPAEEPQSEPISVPETEVTPEISNPVDVAPVTEQLSERLAIERAPEAQVETAPASAEQSTSGSLRKVKPLSTEEAYDRLEPADERTGFVGDEVHIDGVPYRIYSKSENLVVLSPIAPIVDLSSPRPRTLTREDLVKHISNGEVRINTYLGTNEPGAIMDDLRVGERFYDTERREMIELARMQAGSMVYKVLDEEGIVKTRSLGDPGPAQIYELKEVERRIGDGRLVPVNRL